VTAPAECNYGIHNKEMPAIIRALQEYRAELEGLQREERFDIFTDHLYDHKGFEFASGKLV
jgi:hypothetical protein